MVDVASLAFKPCHKSSFVILESCVYTKELNASTGPPQGIYVSQQHMGDLRRAHTHTQATALKRGYSSTSSSSLHIWRRNTSHDGDPYAAAWWGKVQTDGGSKRPALLIIVTHSCGSDKNWHRNLRWRELVGKSFFLISNESWNISKAVEEFDGFPFYFLKPDKLGPIGSRWWYHPNSLEKKLHDDASWFRSEPHLCLIPCTKSARMGPPCPAIKNSQFWSGITTSKSYKNIKLRQNILMLILTYVWCPWHLQLAIGNNFPCCSSLFLVIPVSPDLNNTIWWVVIVLEICLYYSSDQLHGQLYALKQWSLERSNKGYVSNLGRPGGACKSLTIVPLTA